MMYFRNNQGFSLIEAMLAVTIIALVLTPMFMLENSIFHGVGRMAETFHRALFAQNFLYYAQRDEPANSTNYTLERKEEKPLTMVRYTLSSLAKGSSLALVKRLFKQQVEASGLEKASPKATRILFMFRPDRGAA
jgi:prepilin-type N-terminal cleavage/methylation domain-containing protein